MWLTVLIKAIHLERDALPGANLYIRGIEDYPVEPRRLNKLLGIVGSQDEYVVADLDFTFSQAFTEPNELKPPLRVSARIAKVSGGYAISDRPSNRLGLKQARQRG